MATVDALTPSLVPVDLSWRPLRALVCHDGRGCVCVYVLLSTKLIEPTRMVLEATETSAGQTAQRQRASGGRGAGHCLCQLVITVGRSDLHQPLHV